MALTKSESLGGDTPRLADRLLQKQYIKSSKSIGMVDAESRLRGYCALIGTLFKAGGRCHFQLQCRGGVGCAIV